MRASTVSSGIVRARLAQDPRFRFNPRVNPKAPAYGGCANTLIRDTSIYGTNPHRLATDRGKRTFKPSRKALKAPVNHPHWDPETLRLKLGEQLALSSGSVRKAFQRFDSDRSGSLDHEEFRKVLRVFNIEMDDPNFREIMHAFDPSGDGEIDYSEFMAQFGEAIAGSKDTGGLSKGRVDASFREIGTHMPALSNTFTRRYAP